MLNIETSASFIGIVTLPTDKVTGILENKAYSAGKHKAK